MKRITEVSRQEINEAIAANNRELVAEMLEGFDFVKDGIPLHFGKPQHDIAESMLTSAIIAAERGVLTDDTAVTIISYLTTSVDFFFFCAVSVSVARTHRIFMPIPTSLSMTCLWALKLVSRA